MTAAFDWDDPRSQSSDFEHDMEAFARSTDPITSHEAAESHSAEKLRKNQQAVLRVMTKYGPCTDRTLVAAYHRSGETPQSDSGIRTRRNELRNMGKVADTGKRVTLDSGRRAILWAARA